MRRSFDANEIARVGAFTIAVCVSFVAIMASLLAAAAGLAAWGDYGSRGCPGAVQCSDAVAIMSGAAWRFPAPWWLCSLVGLPKRLTAEDDGAVGAIRIALAERQDEDNFKLDRWSNSRPGRRR